MTSLEYSFADFTRLFIVSIAGLLETDERHVFDEVSRACNACFGVQYGELDFYQARSDVGEIYTIKSPGESEAFSCFLSDAMRGIKDRDHTIVGIIIDRVVDGWLSVDPQRRYRSIVLCPILFSENAYDRLVSELEKRTAIVDWFDQQQLVAIQERKYEEADFLRDISVITAAYGDFEMGLSLIRRARELRPHGPVIHRLEKELQRQYQRRSV